MLNNERIVKRIGLVFLGWCLVFISYSQSSETEVYIKLIDTHAPVVAGAKLLHQISDLPSVLQSAPLHYGNSQSDAHRVQPKKSKYLNGISKVTLSSEVDLDEWISMVKSYANVAYVEVVLPVKVLYTPNDSLIAHQDYLKTIKAYEAWDIAKGDSNLVIGISDTGVDYLHHDLKGKLAYNTSDPVNQQDDDGNGYIDDYWGWDLADEDNDPMADTPMPTTSHGTMVAGIAGAYTHNERGITGVGFRTKYLPIKVFSSKNGVSYNVYPSIIYAADRGVAVINLSWGTAFAQGYSLLQDFINYAVLEKDVVVVAAAGNTNADLDFYPASYDHVLSVGMSNTDDTKDASATYSYKIDLMAPGHSVYSTQNGNSYGSDLGSSFSSPQVAATAALVKSVFPKYNAIQIMEQIRISSDDIYSVGDNANYRGKLGHGRLNMYRAVSEKNNASIRAINFKYAGAFDQLLFRDDTVTVDIEFVNILRATENAQITLSSSSPYIELLTNEMLLGSLATLDTSKQHKIKIRLKSNLPPHQKVGIRMDYTDTKGYKDFEYFEFTSAPDYLTIANGKLANTIGGAGRIGYAADQKKNGYGLNLNGVKIAENMGLIIGTHQDSISDNVINHFGKETYENDFVSDVSIKYTKRKYVDQYILSTFTDNIAKKKLGLIVEQAHSMWNATDENDYMISEYRVTNTNTTAINNLRVGVFADFNINNHWQNFAKWDATNQLGYTYDQDNKILMGMSILTNQNAFYTAIDLFDKNGNGIDIDSIFTDSLKFVLLTKDKQIAGGDEGHDVAQLTGVHIPKLAAYNAEKIAVVWVFGNSLEELIANKNKAQDKYDLLVNHPPVNWLVGTCENTPVKLSNKDSVTIYSDPLGSNKILGGKMLILAAISKDTTYYYRKHTHGYSSDLFALYIAIANPKTKFTHSPNSLYLGDIPHNEVQFQDLSLGANTWQWDFDNQSFSILKNPTTNFDKEGTYSIKLTSTTPLGCKETKTQSYVVRKREDAPQIDNQVACHGTKAVISAKGGNHLRVYTSAEILTPIYEGKIFTSPTIIEETVYYCSSNNTANESVRIPVKISIDPIKANFIYSPDTLNLNARNLMRIEDYSQNTNHIVWSINGTPQGGKASFVYDYTNLTQVQIMLTATSSRACKNVKTQLVRLSKTNKGGVNANTICRWDPVVVAPLHGSAFIYYNDIDRTKILAKGAKATFRAITRDTSFFIGNITNYIESDLISFDVKVEDFQTKIIASPDSLLWSSQPYASFKIDNSAVITAKWFIDQQLTALNLKPTFTFPSLKDYALLAVSKNSSGCIDSATLNYKVYEMPILNLKTVSSMFYPNPTSNIIHWETTTLITNFKLIDLAGKHLEINIQKNKKGYELDTSILPTGIYLLWYNQGIHSHFKKIIKK